MACSPTPKPAIQGLDQFESAFMTRVVFICSQNKLRSPTAEQVFKDTPGLEVISRGTDATAREPLTADAVDWADILIVMEKHHRNKVQKKFKAIVSGKRLVVLDIPDEYEFMDPTLINLLKAKVARVLPSHR